MNIYLSTRISTFALALYAILVGVPAAAQTGTHAAEIQRILANPVFKAATGTLDKEYCRIVEDGIKLTEIPEPPFKEDLRAKAYAQMFKEVGLADVKIDEVGNVLGVRKGSKSYGKFVVVSAHLDTVFPAGTDVKVKREGTKLFTPRQAPWARSETWHADQVGEATEDGGYLLTIPYSNQRELILDVMRYGPDVRVMVPFELQQEVAKRLRAAADQYT